MVDFNFRDCCGCSAHTFPALHKEKNTETSLLRVRSIGLILELECEGSRLNVTFTRILMLLEYKEDMQYRFPTKFCGEIVLHSAPKKNLEAIRFILIPE